MNVIFFIDLVLKYLAPITMDIKSKMTPSLVINITNCLIPAHLRKSTKRKYMANLYVDIS